MASSRVNFTIYFTSLYFTLLYIISISPVYKNSRQNCDLREATLRPAGSDKNAKVTTLKAAERVTTCLNAEGGWYLTQIYLRAFPT
jgi:hypothetical protein